MKSLKKKSLTTLWLLLRVLLSDIFFHVFELDFGFSQSVSLSLEIFFQTVLFSIVTIIKYSTDLESRNANFQSFHLYLLKEKESLCFYSVSDGEKAQNLYKDK